MASLDINITIRIFFFSFFVFYNLMVGLKRFEHWMYLLETIEDAKTKITQGIEEEINLCIARIST